MIKNASHMTNRVALVSLLVASTSAWHSSNPPHCRHQLSAVHRSRDTSTARKSPFRPGKPATGRRATVLSLLPEIIEAHSSWAASDGPSFLLSGLDAAAASSNAVAAQAAEAGAQLSSWLPGGLSIADASSSAAAGNPTDAAFDAVGRDLLIFLGATSAVVPLCKAVNISPVLGFLAAGVLLGPAGFGMFADLSVDNKVGEVGILFLLFEQGLELSLKRLKALAKYAFGMGLLQIVLCTVVFTLFPFLGGVDLLVDFVGSDLGMVDIRRFDESLVVGASLALSSSAFVLKLLQEQGQLTERVGSASLGVLLMQDIAVVPLLVLLPLIVQEQSAGSSDAVTLVSMAQSAGTAVGALALLGWGGRYVLRFVFDLVASAKSSETFVALCLLVVLGTGALTEALGLSSTLGAFLAGTLLAETNYRTTVEADLQPFRGLLLGLFFMTTGASVDPQLVLENWPTVLALLLGLVSFKAVIITCLGRVFKLSWGESVRTGLLLAGGGEFAFVVLTLAEQLEVIPFGLARLLTAIVVMSMALTPALGTLGDYLAGKIEGAGVETWGQNYLLNSGEAGSSGGESEESMRPGGASARGSNALDSLDFAAANTVVVCGFGPVGQTVASMLTSSSWVAAETETSWVGFDLDPGRVREARKRGYPVFYGDASMPGVVEAAGVVTPRTFVVTYTDADVNFHAVERLHELFPSTPILTRARSQRQLFKLSEAGAADVVAEQTEAALGLGVLLLQQFGLNRDDVLDTAARMRSTLTTRSMARGKLLEELDNAKATATKNKAGASPSSSSLLSSSPFTQTSMSSIGALEQGQREVDQVQQEKQGPTAAQLDRNMLGPDDLESFENLAPSSAGGGEDRAAESVLAPARRPDVLFTAPSPSSSQRNAVTIPAEYTSPQGVPGVDFCFLDAQNMLEPAAVAAIEAEAVSEGSEGRRLIDVPSDLTDNICGEDSDGNAECIT